jgi:hypothetical protein
MAMVKNGDNQFGLFSDTYTPAWKKSAPEFDPQLAEKWKREALEGAARKHQVLLDVLRPELIKIALSRDDRCVTADDAQAWLIDHGYPGALGNAAGSLFRSSDWELVGYRPSERTSRNRSIVGVWKLRVR